MHNKVVSGLICEKDLCKIKEAVCVQVEKVYDSCKEKDCIENAKVIFTDKWSQILVNKAINVKARKAEVVDVYADIEPVPFKRGFYTVDVKFFIKVTLDFFVPSFKGCRGTHIVTKNGLVMFDKKVILFGSEGSIKIFKSHFSPDKCGEYPIKSRLEQDNLPMSKIEVAEPICLSAKLQDSVDKYFEDCCCDEHLSDDIREIIDDNRGKEYDEYHDEKCEERVPLKRVVVSLGLFSIIKLVRLVQLLVPAFDFCIPDKHCKSSTEEDPCDLFETIEFPFDEFYPPQKFDFPGAIEIEKRMIGEPNGDGS
jgi:hypothetical protein